VARRVSELTAGGTRGAALPPIAGADVRWLGFSPAAPERNMAIDRALILAARAPALRLYAWEPPGVSLGWFQRDVDTTPFVAQGYSVVRRLTGGGAVVHHDEVTYAIVLPTDHPLIAARDALGIYDAIHAPIRAELNTLGIRCDPSAATAPESPAALLCFERSSPFDVRSGGIKLVGSAQRRLPDRVLQHGSIVLGPNPVQPRQPTLSSLAGRPISARDLAAALESAFARALPLVPAALTADEEAVAAS